MAQKGNSVSLKTFVKWNLTETFGYEQKDGLVVKVWCKTCAKHKDFILKNVWGKVAKDMETFVNGTAYVSKYTLLRHFESKVHKLGQSQERLIGGENQASTSNTQAGSEASTPSTSHSQPKINVAVDEQSTEAYKKLMRTAYHMALDGLPMRTFKTLVTTQKVNGVQLITGYDSSDRALVFIQEIAKVIRSKTETLINDANAFSILCDGSQARKTGGEKELIMVRVVKDGEARYICAALEDIDDYGDATAANLRTALDHVFTETLRCEDSYKNTMVSATADGANVNFGVYNGLLTTLKRDGRDWLLNIHCTNHRVELAIKDSLLKDFSSINDFMVTLYYLFKRSGKLKRNFRDTAKALGVTVYNFSKVHGTRFVNHQRNGVSNLLHNWNVLIMTIENLIETNNAGGQNAKLRGVLKSMTDFRFLTKCCIYKHILDIYAKLSLKFERNELQVCEIKTAIEIAQSEFDEILITPEESFEANTKRLLKSAGNSMEISDIASENPVTLSQTLPKDGHMRRKEENREYSGINYDKLKFVDESAIDVIYRLQDTAKTRIKKCLAERFRSFEEEIFAHMNFISDPSNWSSDEITAEIPSLIAVAEHFSSPLSHKALDASKLRREWQDLRITVKNFYPKLKCSPLWKQLLNFRRANFPNVCQIAELVLTIGLSNAVVESGFSRLTALLSDRRLSMAHSTMEAYMLIQINHTVWDEKELKEILDTAVNNFKLKKRKKKMEGQEYPVKRRKIVDNDDSDNDSDSDTENEMDVNEIDAIMNRFNANDDE